MIIVFLNKVDLVKNLEDLELVKMDIEATLEEYGFNNTVMIEGSALKAVNEIENNIDTELGKGAIRKLLKALDTYIIPSARDADKPSYLAIEHIYSITGRGTVVTGTVEQGMLKAGETYDLIGFLPEKTGKPIIIKEIEAFHQTTPIAEPKFNVGLLVAGVNKEDLHRGQCIVARNQYKGYMKFKAEIYILTKEEGGRDTGFQNGYAPTFFISTANCTGDIELPSNIQLALPGDNLQLVVTLINNVCMRIGQSISIREGGRTIGAGKITELIE